MATLQKVALAGGSGELGQPILDALIAAKFQVTVLSRLNSSTTFPNSVKVAKVDYNAPDSLREALHGQDALISTLTTNVVDQQYILFDAAISAGVQRIIPSEFGLDTMKPKVRALPVYTQKVAIQEHLAEATRDTQTSYTFFINGIFLDWAIHSTFLLNVKEKEIKLFDGGETEYSVSFLSTVAQGIVGVLKYPEETANRAVRVHSMVLTQKRVWEIAQRALGEEGWTISRPETVEAERSAWERLEREPEETMGWIFEFLQRGCFAEEYEPRLGEVDNEVLGVPLVGEDKLEAFIKKVYES